MNPPILHTKLANGRRNDTGGSKREGVKESDGNREEILKIPMETPKRAEAAAAVGKFVTKSPAQLID